MRRLRCGASACLVLILLLLSGALGGDASHGGCSLANEGDIPPPSHSLHALYSAASEFWRTPGPISRKRIALRHALLKGTSAEAHHYEGKQPDIHDAAVAIATQMLALGQHMPCLWDLSLPKGLPADMKYMIAANLRNNEDLMPHWMRQLLIAVIGDATSDNADGHVMISIYESGSTDDTPKFLAILEVLLLAVGIPHAITASGNLTRNELERIEFLAQVRNAALAPLVHHKHYPDGFPAERIVFINDVYFCAQNIVRLTQYKSADMACAMDFYDLLGQDKPYAFYDTWVARDIGGNKVGVFFPVVVHNESVDAMREGWPFPVQCCWNGLVVLNAEPFRKHGLMFRAPLEGECRASECSLLCDDFARLGYGRLLMDPSVRMTYIPWDLQRLFGDLLGAKVPWRNWASLVARHISHGYTTDMALPAGMGAGGADNMNPGRSHIERRRALRGRTQLSRAPLAGAEDKPSKAGGHTSAGPYAGDVVAKFWPDHPLPEKRECCNKHPAEDWVYWDECAMQDFMAPNFTDSFFKQTASNGGLRAAGKLLKTGTCK